MDLKANMFNLNNYVRDGDTSIVDYKYINNFKSIDKLFRGKRRLVIVIVDSIDKNFNVYGRWSCCTREHLNSQLFNKLDKPFHIQEHEFDLLVRDEVTTYQIMFDYLSDIWNNMF